MRLDRGTKWGSVAVAVVAFVAAGCASRNIAKDRVRLVEAEAIDARQRASVAEQETRDAQLRADQVTAQHQETSAQLQQKEQQVLALTAEATAGRQAQMALARQTDNARRQTSELQQLQEHVSQLSEIVAQYRKQYADQAQNKPSQDYVTSESLDAFRQDLTSRLRANGINLPVETRTLASGEQRVAVVLRGAFPAGKHSLAHDMDAVKAVVWLGELISRDYRGSRVRIEGHTDSDPLRKSRDRYRDNYELSLKRAESVQDLLTKAGVPGGQIETVGRGPDDPIESENTKRGKEVNRRVEIYIQPAV